MLALTLLVLGQYITLQNEGTTVGQARRLNCVGSGVTCSVSGSTGTLTVTGGGGGGAPPACTTGKAVTSDGDALICTAVLYASDVQCGSACVADAEISAVSGAKVSGAVATATALASDPTDCAGGQYATGIAASGALTCSAVTTAQLSGTVSDAQLANNYSGVGACGANQWASTLNDNAAPTCTQPAFTNISGTVAAAQLPNPSAGTLGGVRSITCGGTDKLSAIGTDGIPVCSADTGGGGSGNFVETSLSLDGAGVYSVVVTGQSWVTTNSKITCTPFGTTADGLTPEAVAAAALSLSWSTPVAATGFTVWVDNPRGLAGTVRLHCSGA